MRSFLIAILLVATASPTIAQTVQNVRASLDGNNVIIQYDLTGSQGQKFKVELYSSSNDYSTPLRMVSGDIGENVTPGSNRRVVWEARKELRIFSGDIQFEIRAESSFSPLVVTTPLPNTIHKGGKSLEINWRGGNSGDRITIDILRDGRMFQSAGSVSNNGSYNWAIPKKIAKSDGYTVRLTSNDPDSQPVNSRTFTMKKKGSPIIPIVAVVAAAAVVGVLVGGGGGEDGGGTGGTGGTSTRDDLPNPPEPPGG